MRCERDPRLQLSVRCRLDLLCGEIPGWDLIQSLHLCLPYPREKSQLSFQDNPYAQFWNTVLGILEAKVPLLEMEDPDCLLEAIKKMSFFCKSQAMSLSALCKVLGNVRWPNSEELGLVPRSTSSLTTILTAARVALGLFTGQMVWGKLTHEWVDIRATICCPIIIQTSAARMRWGHEKTHPEETCPLLSSPEGRPSNAHGLGNVQKILLQLCPQAPPQIQLNGDYRTASQRSHG